MSGAEMNSAAGAPQHADEALRAELLRRMRLDQDDSVTVTCTGCGRETTITGPFRG
jgi:hypothetical protein